MFRLRNKFWYQKLLCNQLGLKTFLFLQVVLVYLDIKELSELPTPKLN